MARLGTQRVDEVLDYDRDIKGKHLIRLKAGVGAGKNYWARHLLEKHPDLQILLITSRRNTAEAQAITLGTDCKIRISELFDINDREWFSDLSGKMIICTNAYIDYFFRNIYQENNTQTHLWNKFDLVFVDEYHALTADASFADSPFLVERFISHTLKLNPTCDVVAMSGTPEISDWLFTDNHWGTEYTTIDLYERCIHLVPEKVILCSRTAVPLRIANLLENNRRVVYFANTVKSMAALTSDLQKLSVPTASIGIAYSESDNDRLLPSDLVTSRNWLREQIVSTGHIPESIKVFITTSQNKEGISIEDDDIRYMFSESHIKADLEQMAGRIRGNPDTGSGLSTLAIVHDADQILPMVNFIEQEFDRKLLCHAKSIMEEHQQIVEQHGQKYNIRADIEEIQKRHRFLRYDFIGKKFLFYDAREHCIHTNRADQLLFQHRVETIHDHLYYEYINGSYISVTGGYELWREWFPQSQLYISSGGDSFLQRATNELNAYLQDNNLIGIPVNSELQNAVLNKILSLIQKYGGKELGFHNDSPKTLGPALKRFGLKLSSGKSHKNTDKIICL